MNDLDVIAQRGASFLIRVDAERARIFDSRHHRLFPPQSIDSALARGYWTAFAGDTTAVADMLLSAREIDDVHETPSLLAESLSVWEVA